MFNFCESIRKILKNNSTKKTLDVIKPAKVRLKKKIYTCKKRIVETPLEPSKHFKLADIYTKYNKWYSAIAEYRTGLTLSNTTDYKIQLSLSRAYFEIGQIDLALSLCNNILERCENNKLIKETENLLSISEIQESYPLTYLDHNRYYRLKILSDHLLKIFPDRHFSVLDVGGGQGELCLFIPKASYVIVDPNINGISGINLPFTDKSFDVVVACHVIEHVPPDKRQEFIYQLCRTAKNYVLLLNPFSNPKSFEVERLQLVFELTKASWAKEHLDSTLPNLDEFENFFRKRGLCYKIQPIGSTAATLAMVFLDHYALSAGCNSELKRIHKFFNTRFWNHLQNNDFPNDYLVEINVSSI